MDFTAFLVGKILIFTLPYINVSTMIAALGGMFFVCNDERNFMKAPLIKIIMLGVVMIFTSQTMQAQEKQNRNIVSIGTGLFPSDWQVRYKIGIGREFQIGYGFSFTSLVEYAEYPKYQLFGNGSVLFNEPSYGFSISGALKISPAWQTAPYLAYGVDLSKIYAGETIVQGLGTSPERTPAQWLENISPFLSAGVDFLPAGRVSIFFELRVGGIRSKNSNRSFTNSILRAGVGLTL